MSGAERARPSPLSDFRREFGLFGVPICLIAVAAIGTIWPTLALGHVAESHPESAAIAWQFEPDIVLMTLFFTVLYVAGLVRLRERSAFPPTWRSASFLAGMALVFLALESPIDPLSEHLFFVHQIQHFLLHSAGPMLVMLGAPQGPLVAGSPPVLRRYLIGPIMGNRPLRAVFRGISRPIPATALFVGSLYVWEWPAFHDLAVRDEAVHYAMHVSMLVAGLVFFWCVFDARPAPLGARYGARVTMLWVAVVGNILLGSVTTLKPTALYTAYDDLGRLWGFGPLPDEQLGGLIIWIPPSMMCLVALFVVISSWGAHETKIAPRLARRLGRAKVSAPAAWDREPEGRARAAARNRVLGLKLAMIALGVFAGILALGAVIVARTH
jgi:putative membrane protein